MVIALVIIWGIFYETAKSLGKIWGIRDEKTSATVGIILIGISFFVLYNYGDDGLLLFGTVLTLLFFAFRHLIYLSLERQNEGNVGKAVDPVLIFYILVSIFVGFKMYEFVDNRFGNELLSYALGCLSFILIWAFIIWSYLSNEFIKKALTWMAYFFFIALIGYQIYTRFILKQVN